jgi:hypothetical protein
LHRDRRSRRPSQSHYREVEYGAAGYGLCCWWQNLRLWFSQVTTEPPLIPPESPKGQKLNALFALMRDIRGTFIDQAIWIDLLTTDILGAFFCPDDERRSLLSSDVLTGRDATFSGRLEILEKIVERWFPAFLAGHAGLFKQLGKIRRLRNRLAHAHLDSSNAFMARNYTDRIQLVFHEDGVEKTQVITVAEFHELLKECTQALTSLAELQKLVDDLPRTPPPSTS